MLNEEVYKSNITCIYFIPVVVLFTNNLYIYKFPIVKEKSKVKNSCVAFY